MGVLKQVVTIMAVSALLMSGCEKHDTEARLGELERRNAELSKQVTELQNSVQERLVTDKYILQRIAEMSAEKKAELDPRTSHYSIAECRVGPLLVSCEGAEPYLDGHRVRLEIGNPLSAGLDGFTVKARYGARKPEPVSAESAEDEVREYVEYLKESTLWRQDLKSCEQRFTQTLSPGTWTAVQLTICPSKAEDIGYLEIGIETDTVSLRGPR